MKTFLTEGWGVFFEMLIKGFLSNALHREHFLSLNMYQVLLSKIVAPWTNVTQILSTLPFLDLISTLTISSLKWAAFCAVSVFCWEDTANSSCSCLEISHCLATFSAVKNI